MIAKISTYLFGVSVVVGFVLFVKFPQHAANVLSGMVVTWMILAVFYYIGAYLGLDKWINEKLHSH